MADQNRLAIVTGTSSGLGAATAGILLEEGWTVVGMSRRKADFGSPDYRHLQVDLGDSALLGEIAGKELTPLLKDGRWRRVGLVNNAAVVGELGLIGEINPASAVLAYAVNVISPVFLMGVVARDTPDGCPLRIINVSTGAAVHPLPGVSEYGGSKAALRLVSMTFASELASEKRPGGRKRDFSVLSYAPGVVDTAMQGTLRSTESPWTEIFADFHRKGMLVPPEGPAREMADFLASESAEPFLERRFGVK